MDSFENPDKRKTSPRRSVEAREEAGMLNPPTEVAPSVRREGGTFEVTIDGEHFIPVPQRLGKVMRIALKLQERINTDPLSLEREFDTITREVEGVNCHKTVLYARGDISYEQLTHTSNSAEHSGHPEVIRLFNQNPENVMFFAGDIREYARSHEKEFPFSVHVFRSKADDWVPAHSFIWLGIDSAGNEICFHKRGPYLDNPFEISTLKKELDPFDQAASVFLIIPFNPTT